MPETQEGKSYLNKPDGGGEKGKNFSGESLPIVGADNDLDRGLFFKGWHNEYRG